MTFGERLFKLRKEKGLSQEALAEQLNTTRQAISKWENNQGYPETEKLLMLSNIFGVSVDSLLKENTEHPISTDKGYYVSRECAEGFLSFHKKTTKRTATGIAIMVLAGVPFFLFENNQILSITFACMVLVIGLIFILSMAMMGNPYRKSKSERLLFDPAYYLELSFAREAQKKKSLLFIIIAISMILAAGIIGMFAIPTFPILEIQCILVACSVYIFVYVIGILDNYDILMNSEERMETIYWRIVKKIKNKMD
ncbi:MAG: helix-turn-helix domain-containing protein [Thomasclavelia sp.]